MSENDIIADAEVVETKDLVPTTQPPVPVEKTNEVEYEVLPNDEDDDEIVIPHEIKSVDEVKEGHIDDNTTPIGKNDDVEIKIDLNDIEFDKNGVPVLKARDRKRILQAGFASPSFNVEISTATESIKRCNEALDEKKQENDEKLFNEAITRLKETLTTETLTEEAKKATEEEIKSYEDMISMLPKNNEETKKTYEKERASSVDLIATYQHISRKTIEDLVKDGSLLALVSNSASNGFVTSYIRQYMKYNNMKFEDNPEIVKIQDQIDQVGIDAMPTMKEYTILSEFENYICWKDLPLLNDDGTPILDEYGDEKSERIRDYDKEKEKSNENGFEQWYGFVKRELPQQFKRVEQIREKYNGWHNVLFYMNMTEYVASFAKKYEEYDDKITDLQILRDEQREIVTKPIKDRLRKQGLVVSMLEYATFAESTRTAMGRNINVINKKYLDMFVDDFYFAIKLLVNKDLDEEFATIRQNVNTISMMQNNMIHYFETLHDNNVNKEYADNFDPESQLKFNYFANEVSYNELIKAYKEQKTRLYSIIRDNPHFVDDYEALINECIVFLENYEKAKTSQNKNKHLKSLKIGFYDQIVNGLKNLLDKQHPKEDSDGKVPEVSPEQVDDAIRPMYSTILHNITGYNLIAAILHFKESMNEDFKNVSFNSDCSKYLFHEFVISLLLIKNIKKDEDPIEFIRKNFKNVAFQSTTFALEKDIDVDSARKYTVEYIFKTTTSIIRDLVDKYESIQEEKPIEISKEDLLKKKKNAFKKEEERNQAIKKAKKVAKEKDKAKKVASTLKSWYSNLDHYVTGWTRANLKDYYRFKSDDNFTIVKLDSADTTTATFFVNHYKKSPTDDQLNTIKTTATIRGKDFDSFVNDNTANSKLNDTVSTAFAYNQKNYKTVTTKWYYNEFKDATKVTPESGSLTKRVIELIFAEEKANNSLEGLIISNLVKNKVLDEKLSHSIKFKDNSRVSVKKYDYHIADSDDLLNFFDKTDELWSAYIIELKYDVISKEVVKVVEKPVEVVNDKRKTNKDKVITYNKSNKNREINPKTGSYYTKSELKAKEMYDLKNGKVRVKESVPSSASISGISTKISRPKNFK